MIALVMAGGKGERMRMPEEKLLLTYKKPIVLHVLDALKDSGCFSKVVAATSPHSPKTGRLLSELGVDIIATKGEGFVNDLNFALSKLDGLVLVVPGDLPLIDSQIIRQIISEHKDEAVWQSFLVSDDLLDSLNIKSEFSVDFAGRKCHYTGLSIVNTRKISSSKIPETYVILDDKRIALNLNTKHEYELLKNS